jgi:hypothetical protein
MPIDVELTPAGATRSQPVQCATLQYTGAAPEWYTLGGCIELNP